MKISSRVSNMQSSPIRKLVPFAIDAKSKGIKVYHLNIGQPDIKTPKVFLESIKEFNQEVISYALSSGDPKLIEAMIKYYKRYNIEYKPEDIIITNGGSEAIQMAIVVATDDGDNIMVPEPFYTNYNGFSQPFGISIKPVTTNANNGFKLPSYEDLLNICDDKTKAILLSNPGNPTGAVYDKNDIDKVVRLAIEKNIYIIADEVYREFVYDGFEYTSFANIKEVEDRVIIIDSISKRFSACGARIGSIACKNKNFMQSVMKLAQARLCVPTLEMVGATALYNLDASYLDPIIKEYKHRRETLINGLNSIEGVSCQMPKGAFYAVATLPIDNAEEFAKWLLKDFSHNNETVMLAPNEGFYATEGKGKNEVRLAYVLENEELKKATTLLEIALKEYKKL